MARRTFFTLAILPPLLTVLAATWWLPALWAFLVIGPALLLGLYDVLQREHSLLRIYPVIGHGRYLLEGFRPEIQQYFVETNTDGMPFSREFRSLIYQRGKGIRETVPFGTQQDVDRIGHEWMTHSLSPRPVSEEPPRCRIGGPLCTRPYQSSYLNISGMSFGALGSNAILALNQGAELGGFAHNTGEGGISPYHLEPGGDLTWQIGTGYFGCRTLDGDFDPDLFQEKARLAAVKMIEIKLSQGAKPGHGGILPGAKVTREIARIRGVPRGRDVISPRTHRSFSTPTGLLEFVARLRDLSDGKPVGFKLCIGHRREFLAICKAMLETGILPDFVTVDGAEGGSGAAPLELSNSVGMPMRDGLLFVNNALRGVGLREPVRVIGAGKIVTGFHMVRTIALGANLCNSARGMMFALGCIQARMCNTNKCPVGIATQDPSRRQGLVVEDKAERVARYHRGTIHSFLQLIASTGLEGPDRLGPHDVVRRIDATTIRRLDELYEQLPEGCLAENRSIPEGWKAQWESASAKAF